MYNFKKLWKHISLERKKQSIIVLLLMFAASIFEVVSIAAIIPFLAALTSPSLLFDHYLMINVIQFLGISESSQLIFPLTLFFVLAVVLAGIVRLALLFFMTRFSMATGADISINIYNRTLYQDYLKHIERNSSSVIDAVISKSNIVISGVIQPILTLINSFILILAISFALFIVSVKVASIAMLGFGLIYLFVILFSRKMLSVNSKRIAKESTVMVKSLQEGFGGIRDVLLSGSQKFYSELYIKSVHKHRIAMGDNEFIGGSPRFIVEAIGMSLIAILAYSLTIQKTGILSALPVLGALALGAQRLLPAIQVAFSAYTKMKSSKASFIDVLELLDQPLPSYASQPIKKTMLFEKHIELKNLSFHYSKELPWVFKNINLKIAKGSRVGFIGQTGCGKSTLLDIMMGLLHPVEGEIFIDKKVIDENNRRSWQSNIAHVPQHVFLSDSSIEDNIAFGILKNEINHEKVKLAAKQAQISTVIESWKDGYKTFVGENGVKLSGGQRQRIGIARALYRDASILVFDEATSALDSLTETAVMDSIDLLGSELTILIIAHRQTTLKKCDFIVEIADNKLSIKEPLGVMKNEKNNIF